MLGPMVPHFAYWSVKPTSTLRQILVSPKDKTDKKELLVLCITFHVRAKIYPTSAKKPTLARLNAPWKRGGNKHRRPSSTSSEVSNHIHIESPGYFVDLDKVRILDKDNRWSNVKEAVYKPTNQLSTKAGACSNLQESTSLLSGQRSNRWRPNTVSQ